MKEQRLSFSDYSAAEQEQDLERYRQAELKSHPHIFLLRVDGVWAHIIFAKDEPLHKFYEGKKLLEVFKEVTEKFPNNKIRYIMNEGIENYLRDIRNKELAVKKMQMTINFKER